MTDAGPPGDQQRYAGALRALLVQMAPPYGFTLATFTAAGMTAHGQGGIPNAWQILLFLAGAFSGYAMLTVMVRSLFERVHPTPLALNGWQMVHVVPLGVVFLLSLASSDLVGYPVAWFTSGIALTVGYLGSFAWVLRDMRPHRATTTETDDRR